MFTRITEHENDGGYQPNSKRPCNIYPVDEKMGKPVKKGKASFDPKILGAALCFGFCIYAVMPTKTEKPKADNYATAATSGIETEMPLIGKMPNKEVEVPKVVPKEQSNATTNDSAPVESIAKDVAEKYIQKYAPLAISEMHRTKVPASVTLAQALIESNAGRSWLARNANNHFGIKCNSKKCKKGHCKNRTDDSHKDFFLNFASIEEGYKMHSDLLAKGRYSGALRFGKDCRKWALWLQMKGYATVEDKTGKKIYAQMLINKINEFNLTKYDEQ